MIYCPICLAVQEEREEREEGHGHTNNTNTVAPPGIVKSPSQKLLLISPHANTSLTRIIHIVSTHLLTYRYAHHMTTVNTSTHGHNISQRTCFSTHSGCILHYAACWCNKRPYILHTLIHTPTYKAITLSICPFIKALRSSYILHTRPIHVLEVRLFKGCSNAHTNRSLSIPPHRVYQHKLLGMCTPTCYQLICDDQKSTYNVS